MADVIIAYMDEIPPGRSRYDEDRKIEIRKKLSAAWDRRRTLQFASPDDDRHAAKVEKPPAVTKFVCILDARDAWMKQQRLAGANLEVAEDDFWTLFLRSIATGEFDGRDRVHVVDDQPVIRMRIRSHDGQALFDDQYSYEQVVGRRLSRAWMSRRTGSAWCERNGFAIPHSWQAGISSGSIEISSQESDEPHASMLKKQLAKATSAQIGALKPFEFRTDNEAAETKPKMVPAMSALKALGYTYVQNARLKTLYGAVADWCQKNDLAVPSARTIDSAKKDFLAKIK